MIKDVIPGYKEILKQQMNHNLVNDNASLFGLIFMD